MGLIIALLLLALLFGGLGLFVTGLKWLIIVAVLVILVDIILGYRRV